MTLKDFHDEMAKGEQTVRMPVLFVGHGSPMNALEDNEFTRVWKELGKRIPTPRVILAISAHWLTEGTFVHEAKNPKTIHDYYGFPEELYAVTYSCPGAPDDAHEVEKLVKGTTIKGDTSWGIDHGTWVPLVSLYPDANIPVFQMSIDISKSEDFHYNLGAELSSLRDKGVLIVGTGNIVHNLGRMNYQEDSKAFDWAESFDENVKELILAENDQALIDYHTIENAKLAVPTPDHYWPFLYALGARKKGETVHFPVNGIAFGSISMRAIIFGL